MPIRLVIRIAPLLQRRADRRAGTAPPDAGQSPRAASPPTQRSAVLDPLPGGAVSLGSDDDPAGEGSETGKGPRCPRSLTHPEEIIVSSCASCQAKMLAWGPGGCRCACRCCTFAACSSTESCSLARVTSGKRRQEESHWGAVATAPSGDRPSRVELSLRRLPRPRGRSRAGRVGSDAPGTRAAAHPLLQWQRTVCGGVWQVSGEATRHTPPASSITVALEDRGVEAAGLQPQVVA